MDKKLIDWFWRSGYTPSAGYQAVLTRATSLGYTLPSAGLIVKQDTLYRALDAVGFFAASNLYYQFQTGDATLKNFSKINWASPSTFELQEVSSPVYDGTGWKSAGAGSYLDTQWDTSTNGGGIYTQNNAGFVCDVLTNQSVDQYAFGSCIAAIDRCLALQPRNANILNWAVNRNSLDTITSYLTGNGFYQGSRSGANTANLAKDGTEIDAEVTGSRALSTIDLSILAININGAKSLYYTNNIGCFGVGASNYANRVAIYNAYNTYKSSL